MLASIPTQMGAACDNPSYRPRSTTHVSGLRMTLIHRRNFLIKSLSCASLGLAAPAIVHAANIMPVRAPPLDWEVQRYLHIDAFALHGFDAYGKKVREEFITRQQFEEQ